MDISFIFILERITWEAPGLFNEENFGQLFLASSTSVDRLLLFYHPGPQKCSKTGDAIKITKEQGCSCIDAKVLHADLKEVPVQKAGTLVMVVIVMGTATFAQTSDIHLLMLSMLSSAWQNHGKHVIDPNTCQRKKQSIHTFKHPLKLTRSTQTIFFACLKFPLILRSVFEYSFF